MISENHSSPAICYGEILWDMLPDGPQPGGAPLNVAYHLNKLGVDTSIVSRIGNDANGDKLEALLDNWQIKKHMLQRDVTYPTSEVIARMNNGNEVSYEIVFPVAWDFINNVDEIKNQIKPSTYLIYGSLSSRHNTSRETLLKILECNAIKVFDINLRPPFVNRDLLETLLHKADIVKFNQAELEMAQSLFRGALGNEASQVKFIQHYFNVQEVIVTKGEFGASYYKNHEVYNAWGSEVKVKDTIGSGDAFLAAFIANHYLNNEPKTTIKNAVAMGAFIATKKGGCPEYRLSEYVNFKSKTF
ncbi:fructokinase [Mucilaginibacter gracilis]|uniref:Fructokinase n=1 Tax=Mucilaginibacter gracilis TaxID=423350 RepID=A0A495IVV4_9SPHI|nr:PfkB family carbohydrate kinase [Mucilaginibacter gracilis]RKR80144.1 fructokinase [Mucilaginibacter gracilis]